MEVSRGQFGSSQSATNCSVNDVVTYLQGELQTALDKFEDPLKKSSSHVGCRNFYILLLCMFT